MCMLMCCVSVGSLVIAAFPLCLSQNVTFEMKRRIASTVCAWTPIDTENQQQRLFALLRCSVNKFGAVVLVFLHSTANTHNSTETRRNQIDLFDGNKSFTQLMIALFSLFLSLDLLYL